MVEPVSQTHRWSNTGWFLASALFYGTGLVIGACSFFGSLWLGDLVLGDTILDSIMNNQFALNIERMLPLFPYFLLGIGAGLVTFSLTPSIGETLYLRCYGLRPANWTRIGIQGTLFGIPCTYAGLGLVNPLLNLIHNLVPLIITTAIVMVARSMSSQSASENTAQITLLNAMGAYTVIAILWGLFQFL